MSDVTPPAGDLPPPPPGPPGAGFWQDPAATGTPPVGTSPLPPPPEPAQIPAPPAPAYAPPPTYEPPPTHVNPTGIQPTLGTTPGPSVPELAGFWRRAWARVITGLFWAAVLQLGIYLITLLFRFIDSAAPNDLTLLGGLGVSFAYGVMVTYLIWSRPLSTRRGTVGMRQMGLSLRSTSRNPAISRAQAFRRSLLAVFPLFVASGSGWLLLYSPDDDAIVLALIIEAALVGLVVLGGLWMLVNPRRQTVWDLVGKTVVVSDREPSWIAVCALAAGVLVPSGAAVSLVVVGASRLQSEYRSLSGFGSAGRYLSYNIPTLVLSVATILLGHVAIRSTRWESHRHAGRGLARTALFLGYLFPVALVATLAFGAIYRQLEDRQVGSCSETRKEIGVAAESFRRLNGVYPVDISTMATGIYLDDPELSKFWTLTSSTSSGQPTFTLVGKDECAGA